MFFVKSYNLLITTLKDHQLPWLTKWQSDLFHYFKPSICTSFQKTNFKLMTQWYYTPSLLHKFFPTTTDQCGRCQEGRGTLLHVFWSCPKLDYFWKEVPDDPAFFLLHISTIPVKIYKRLILRHLLNAAKSCIPSNWKHPQPPTGLIKWRKSTR